MGQGNFAVTAAEIVEAAAGSRLLVFGSPPPTGRDLDLLTPDEERQSIEAALLAAGFHARGHTWLRLRDCRAEVVDLVPAHRWGLPGEEAASLFAQARPLPGYQHLGRPAPHHALLILARRVAVAGILPDKHLARLQEIVAEDPRVWALARERAGTWHVERGLDLLEAAAVGHGRPPLLMRLSAAVERRRGLGASISVSWAAVLRGSLRGRRRGRVVAICGLDGAGKSSQAAALAETLERLGHEAVTQWTRLSYNPSLDVVAEPVKWLLALPARRAAAGPPPPDLDPSRVAQPAQRVRQRSTALTVAWSTLVAVLNGLSQRRTTAEHLRAGRIVVCDRWTLDSAVHLRYRYGESRRFRFQVALIRFLSPRPVLTFFLHIPPEVAYARKDDHYQVSQLRRQASLYQEEYRRFGALRMDGQLPKGELCTQIAQRVAAVLEEPSKLRRVLQQAQEVSASIRMR